MNVATYLMINNISDDYFKSLYRKRDINLSKAVKFLTYALAVLFVVGAVFDVLTRESLVLFVESFLFILTSLLVIWRIYKMEDRGSEVITENTVDQAQVDAVNLDYTFYVRSILIFTAIGSVGFISFIFFLSRFKP